MSDYQEPSDEYINSRSGYLQQLFTGFVNLHPGNFISNVQIDMDCVRDCVLRVQQREYYFKTFHDMPSGLSEIKRIALYCYWILKYRPFFLNFKAISQPEDGYSELQNHRKKYFLERFCIYLLTMQIRRLYKGVMRLPLFGDGINDLVYSLRHHDITKEALTELFEMLEDVVKICHNITPLPNFLVAKP